MRINLNSIHLARPETGTDEIREFLWESGIASGLAYIINSNLEPSQSKDYPTGSFPLLPTDTLSQRLCYSNNILVRQYYYSTNLNYTDLPDMA